MYEPVAMGERACKDEELQVQKGWVYGPEEGWGGVPS